VLVIAGVESLMRRCSKKLHGGNQSDSNKPPGIQVELGGMSFLGLSLLLPK
jgi:hypothetical protein